MLVLLWHSPARAASVETSHQVTVIVIPPSLSFQEENGTSSSLTFDEPESGEESNEQRVNYRLGGNSFSSGPVPGLVTATVESPEGIQMKAELGTFTNDGTRGNILLRAAVSGEQVIGEVPVELAEKGPTAGPQAEVLNGTLPVYWKASATQDLFSDNYQTTLTVTLKDS